MKTMLATCLIGGIFGAFSTFADTLELKILDGEYWWAGLSSRGTKCPMMLPLRCPMIYGVIIRAIRRSLCYSPIKDGMFGASSPFGMSLIKGDNGIYSRGPH